MAKKAVTLYIDDTSIRLMVTSGQRVNKLADVPLEPGLVKNSVVQKPEEVADKIRQLFKVRKINSKKVILGISGLHCLTRPILLPQLPKDMLEEAVRREAKRILPVSPEQLYLQWQPIPAPEGKAQVFLVAIPRTAADALFNTLRLAGLKSDLMDLKPMLLARMVKDTMAVIVDVQPTEFDIVVMAGGIPQPVRTVSFPDEASSWQEKTTLIKDDVSRTIEFYNTNNPETPLAATLPVWASGELANESEQCQVLSDGLSRPVLPLPPPFESPDGLDPSRYSANMGLVLKKIAPTNGSGLSVSELNVVPVVYRPEPISLTRILALPSAVIAISLLLFLALMIQNTSADITETRGQLNTTNQLLQQKMVQNQKYADAIAELQLKINNTETSGGNFALALSTLETQSEKVNGNLEVIVNSLPETVSLTSISHTSNTLTLNGQAPGEEDLLSYLRELEASERFSSITITSLGRTAVSGTNFNVILGVGE
ncbi:MAG: pilus assembly protein PilM [Chloroflexota bacterium]